MPPTVGIFDWLASKSQRDARKASAALASERAGELAEAVDLYSDAGLPDEAARVLLLRADAESSAEKRIALCSLASFTATSEELRRKARGRKARVVFDVLQARAPAFMKSELVAVARELEELGELELAADAYAMAGDGEAEARVLTALGASERLEERRRGPASAAREQHDRERTLQRLAELDRAGGRRAALELAVDALDRYTDERLAQAARVIRTRLLRGPVVELEIDGASGRYALGSDVTIGRGDATIMIVSPMVSRRHLRLFRTRKGAYVEDLATRNGTSRAGTRLTVPIAIGGGVQLELGGEVPCAIRPLEPDQGSEALPADGDLFMVEVPGAIYIAPLGELAVGDWRIVHETVRDEAYVVLRTPSGADRPHLGEAELGAQIELSVGDELRAPRGGPIRLRVPASHRMWAMNEETAVIPRPDPMNRDESEP